MPTTMALWRLNDAGSRPRCGGAACRGGADWSAVESLPELLGDEVLIIGRQVATPSGPLICSPSTPKAIWSSSRTSATARLARCSHKPSTTRRTSAR